jgi:hypothetical protein
LRGVWQGDFKDDLSPFAASQPLVNFWKMELDWKKADGFLSQRRKIVKDFRFIQVY